MDTDPDLRFFRRASLVDQWNKPASKCEIYAMPRYLLCTGNPGKVNELRALLPHLELVSLQDAGLPTDLPETGHTFEANALQKARFAFERTGLPCIADDSGLEVEALGGLPGVDSAYYAGPQKDDRANVAKLLGALRGEADRRARFRTVIALVEQEGEHFFEGEVRGTITTEARGTNGFGYDPVFIPGSSELTFAELDAVQKNAISHRGHAVWKLVRFLAERQG
jgi:XTP/dITP diphosphohydrolase